MPSHDAATTPRNGVWRRGYCDYGYRIEVEGYGSVAGVGFSTRHEAREAMKAARADVDEQSALIARCEELADALSKIAAPKRPDGTYNLSREACEQIAREALRHG